MMSFEGSDHNREARVDRHCLGTILLYETDTGTTDHNHYIDILTGLAL